MTDRGRRLVLLGSFLALWAGTAAGQTVREANPERLVVYFNEDSPRALVAYAKFRTLLLESAGRRGLRVRVEHAKIDIASGPSIRAAVTAALARRPAVLVTPGAVIARYAKDIAKDVPVVFAAHQDPIELGFVETFRRPGGNLTGLTFYRGDEAKRLEMLREIAPASRRLGVITDAWWDRGEEYRHPSARKLGKIAAEQFGFEVEYFQVDTERELREMVGSARARKIDVWYSPANAYGFDHPATYASVLAQLRRPVIYAGALFANHGGMLSYEQTFDDPLGTLAKLTGVVLDGVPPAEIPVERPRLSVLTVNLTAALAQGITLPKSLLLRADVVK